MSSKWWLRSLVGFRSLLGEPRRRKGRHRPLRRCWLEALEERAVPATGFAVGAGAGAAPQVKLFDGSPPVERASFLAYAESYTGGVRIALGDVTGDGVVDVLAVTGGGTSAHVKVFDGNTFAEVRSFLPFGADFQSAGSI